MKITVIIFVFITIFSVVNGQQIFKRFEENTKHNSKNICSFKGIKVEPNEAPVPYNSPECARYSCSRTYTMTIEYCVKIPGSKNLFPSCCSR